MKLSECWAGRVVCQQTDHYLDIGHVVEFANPVDCIGYDEMRRPICVRSNTDIRVMVKWAIRGNLMADANDIEPYEQ